MVNFQTFILPFHEALTLMSSSRMTQSPQKLSIQAHKMSLFQKTITCTTQTDPGIQKRRFLGVL